MPSDAWGRYPPHMRYNCDQVLFNLDTAGGRHFGTLQACVHAGACTSQPPLTMLFRVFGPKDLTQEFPRYHPGVRVLWNRTGYMDRKEAMSWAKEVVVPFLEQKHPGDRQVLLLQDSFPANRTCEYVRLLQGIGVEIAYGPRIESKFWQPIDAGRIGEVLKKLANAEFEKWMETVSNPDAPMESRKYHWQLWESNKMTQMGKRILMTWVFGRAWDQLLTSRLKNIST